MLQENGFKALGILFLFLESQVTGLDQFRYNCIVLSLADISSGIFYHFSRLMYGELDQMFWERDVLPFAQNNRAMAKLSMGHMLSKSPMAQNPAVIDTLHKFRVRS